MTLLALYRDQWMNSVLIASSLNINPVLVRRELTLLKKGNLIESKEGKNGGVRLIKDPNTILLSDIFNLAKGEETVLSLSKNTPNPSCRVGKQINENLMLIMKTIDDSIINTLKLKTLEEFKNKF